jgi:hypothetical protein
VSRPLPASSATLSNFLFFKISEFFIFVTDLLQNAWLFRRRRRAQLSLQSSYDALFVSDITVEIGADCGRILMLDRHNPVTNVPWATIERFCCIWKLVSEAALIDGNSRLNDTGAKFGSLAMEGVEAPTETEGRSTTHSAESPTKSVPRGAENVILTP